MANCGCWCHGQPIAYSAGSCDQCHRVHFQAAQDRIADSLGALGKLHAFNDLTRSHDALKAENEALRKALEGTIELLEYVEPLSHPKQAQDHINIQAQKLRAALGGGK